jgi:hypothetical protein
MPQTSACHKGRHVQVNELFNPIRGIRDVQKRSGKVPVDHTKNNRKAIADQSRLNAARKQVRYRLGLVLLYMCYICTVTSCSTVYSNISCHTASTYLVWTCFHSTKVRIYEHNLQHAS